MQISKYQTLKSKQQTDVFCSCADHCIGVLVAAIHEVRYRYCSAPYMHVWVISLPRLSGLSIPLMHYTKNVMHYNSIEGTGTSVADQRSIQCQ